MRKPRDRSICHCVHACVIGNVRDNAGNIVPGDIYIRATDGINPKESRTLAKWLVKAAKWLEQENRSK